MPSREPQMKCVQFFGKSPDVSDWWSVFYRPTSPDIGWKQVADCNCPVALCSTHLIRHTPWPNILVEALDAIRAIYHVPAGLADGIAHEAAPGIMKLLRKIWCVESSRKHTHRKTTRLAERENGIWKLAQVKLVFCASRACDTLRSPALVFGER